MCSKLGRVARLQSDVAPWSAEDEYQMARTEGWKKAPMGAFFQLSRMVRTCTLQRPAAGMGRPRSTPAAIESIHRADRRFGMSRVAFARDPNVEPSAVVVLSLVLTPNDKILGIPDIEHLED